MKLEIKNLKVEVEGKEILHGLDLTVNEGEIAGIMGRNGSGKSTLSKTIFGHPEYTVTEGDILIDGQSILELSTDKRARLGLFLGFQNPTSVDGVTLSNFLRSAIRAHHPDEKLENPIKFHRRLRGDMQLLGLSDQFISRGVNEKASGGERKKSEIIQMKYLDPKIVIMDEIDSGLDIDALKAVAESIVEQNEQNNAGFLLITHYNRLLTYTKPDVVHLMHEGRIIKSGGPELALELEEKGYEEIVKEALSSEYL